VNEMNVPCEFSSKNHAIRKASLASVHLHHRSPYNPSG